MTDDYTREQMLSITIKANGEVGFMAAVQRTRKNVRKGTRSRAEKTGILMSRLDRFENR